MSSIKTRGIILKRWSFGEADRVLTMLTPGLGKISAIAKGSRRPTSKLAGHIELFSMIDFILAEGRTWYIVSAADTYRSFQARSLETTQQAGYFAKLVNRVTQENDESSLKIFDLLSRALESLDDGRNTLISRQFEWQLLLAIGNQPELKVCSHCAKELSTNELGLCPKTGGALCPSCLKTEAIHVPISADSLKVLRLFEKAPVILADRLTVSSTLESELERVTRAFLEYTLETSVNAS